MAEQSKLSTKEAAEAIGTDPKRLRVFLRASPDYEAVGAGSRYSFTKKDLPKLKKRFSDWAASDDKRKADRKERLAEEKAAADTTPPEVEPSDDDLPEPDNIAGEIRPDLDIQDDHTADDDDVPELEEEADAATA